MTKKIAVILGLLLLTLNSFAMTNEDVFLSFDENNQAWISQPGATLVFPMTAEVVSILEKLDKSADYKCRGKVFEVPYYGARRMKQIFTLGSCKAD